MKKILEHNSLFKKIALWQAVALLIFAVVTGVLFSYSYARYTFDNYLTEVSRSISASVSDHVEDSGYSPGSREKSEIYAYTSLISSASRMSGITVWIVTDKKELISLNRQTGRLEFDQPPTRYRDMLSHMLEGNDVHNETYKKIWNRNMFGVGTPIVDSGGFVIGVVIVQTSLDVVLQALKTTLLNLFFSLLTAMLVTLLLAVSVYRVLTKPLEHIQTSARELQNGNYDVCTEVGGTDELGQLAAAMDELAARLKKARAEREGLDKMKENFMTGISHELRTPVAVIRASLEALCDGLVTEPEKVAQYHQAMLRDSVQLHRLVQDLLDLSGLRSTEMTLNTAPCNPCELVRDAVSGVMPLAEQSGVCLGFRCLCSGCETKAGAGAGVNKDGDAGVRADENGGIRDCGSCFIDVDYGRIRQVLTILEDNAIKFTPAGKSVTVSVCYTDRLICTVEDEGCGITEEELPSVFERFYRGQTTADKEGCGLGLAIAAQIAKGHGIRIQVESNVDVGSRFTLVFPPYTEKPLAEIVVGP